jgi:SAM-dependent methyltransferase
MADPTSRQSFDELVAQAQSLQFSGWNFSFMSERWRESALTWDYGQIVRARLPHASSLLDMGTGGGERLSALQPLPRLTCATEDYPPNVPVAQARLAPLGVALVEAASEERLPFADGAFELVINRHASYLPPELLRILRPGGTFITQQVGDQDNLQLNTLLDAPAPADDADWNLLYATHALAQAGFAIVDQREEFPATVFADIGAVVFYLRVISWQIPGFSVESYRDRLWALHRRMQEQGGLVIQSHRFLIEARK